ncbi:MAG: outer membrane protein assembly factor BamD [Pseudomonadota bacterium]
MTLFTRPPQFAGLIITLGFVLAGCASDPEVTQDFGSASEIYARAQKSMESGNFRNAIFVFEQLESRYPFSAVGKQSQLDLLYCYYKSGSTEQAIDAADQFMRENPTHPRVDYALYIKGLALFDPEPGVLSKLSVFRVDRATRPPNDSRRSFSVFRQLVERYPASDYAEDAVLRMRFIKNNLARYENQVADYYLRRGANVAALKRAREALMTYNGTPANERSLEIMIEAYENLGMTDLASATQEVLDINFPSS